jgi:uncharacterized repeat protein (TIGR01451 family)
MRKILLFVTLLSLISFLGRSQVKPDLGKAAAYTILAGAGVENTGDTKIDGNLGISPGTVYTGMAPGDVKGREDVANTSAAEAQADLVKACQHVAQQVPTQNLTGQSLVRRVLTPGVYKFDGPLTLNDTLFLDNRGNIGGAFLFQVGGNLTLADFAVVKFLKAATPRTQDVFWQVAGSATLGPSSKLQGTVLADQHITLGSSARIQGRLLSRSGTISLASNIITIPTDIAVHVSIPAGRKYTVGDRVPFTITARNNGPLGADVVVNTALTPGLTYVSSTPAGSFDPLTGKWFLPVLADGAAETLQIVVEINSNASASTEFVRSAIDFNGVSLVDEVFDNNAKTVDICVAPTVPGTITGPAAACVGSEVTYSISAINGATGYDWSWPSDWKLKTGTNSNTHSITLVVGSEAGQVQVVVKNICTESDPSIKQITTSTTPPPSPGPISPGPGGVNPCLRDVTATYSIGAVATATSYLWEVPGDWKIRTGQGTTAITVEIGTTAGKIKVTAINGCSPANPPSELAVTASVAAPARPDAIIGELSPCSNLETTYSVSGSSGATSFTWTLPAGWVIKAGTNANASSIVVVPGTSGGEIQVTATNGCGTTSAQTLAAVPITNTAPLAITGPENLCLNADGTRGHQLFLDLAQRPDNGCRGNTQYPHHYRENR